MSDNIPDPLVRELLANGYGQIALVSGGAGLPESGLYVISLREMTAMGAEERRRLGLEEAYQFALEHVGKL